MLQEDGDPNKKRLDPNSVTKAELEEIIRQEEFSAATEHLRTGKTRVR